MQSVCVFLGSNPGAKTDYSEATRSLGLEMARRGLTLVYGGCGMGLMRVLADAVFAGNGRVIGVVPRIMMEKNMYDPRLRETRIVDSVGERKAVMTELSDGFIALPGGLGTLDEFSEVLTGAQLGFHGKPCGLLNVAGFWDAFLQFLDLAEGEGFIASEHRRLVLTDDTPDGLLDRLLRYRAPANGKWTCPPPENR